MTFEDKDFEAEIENKAFDWGIDYKPWEEDLPYRDYARHGYVEGYKQAVRDQLPEGMEHCTITYHQCSKGHGWLSATNWIQHGCSKCKRDKLEAQSFDAYIERKFQKNLDLAREELSAVNDYDGYSDRQAWNMAVEWTQEDIANYVGQMLENRWWAKQEGINKAFYD